MNKIKEVARLANVSAATVSRVLNNTCYVDEEKRKKVLRAAEALQYDPQFAAKRLRTAKSGLVLVILNSMVNTFYAKVVRGIEEEAAAHGCRVLVGATYDDAEAQRSYLALLRNGMADGCILLSNGLPPEELEAAGRRSCIVQTVEDGAAPSVPYVSVDNRAAARDAVRYLIDTGCRKVLHLGAGTADPSARLRLLGYRDALAECGLPYREELILAGNYGYRNALELVSAFFRSGEPVDAIFAVSDRMAAAALAAAEERGLSVPDRLSVMGFDNTDLSYIARPRLTTVSQEQAEIGREAMRMLARKIAGEAVESRVLPHRIVVRETTRKAPSPD